MTNGNLVVSPQERRVLLNATEVLLRPREFDLLTYLVRNRGMRSPGSNYWIMSGAWITTAIRGRWMCICGSCARRSRAIRRTRPGS